MVYIVIAMLVIILISNCLKIVQEYVRGAVFRLGRYVGIRGPGLVFLIPFVERMRRVDLRVITMDVPRQECMTVDNVTVSVDAVVYFRVVDPTKAILKVNDYIKATHLLAQTTLRNVVGQSELDALLSHRDQLNEKIQKIVDEGTDPWGVKVSMVETKEVELPEGMQRAMAAQAEAERERRAKVVHAEGEYQASENLAKAAEIISAEPAALQLRYLQTLSSIATDRSNTILFPLPLDMITAFIPKSNLGKK
ncbi:MAG: slipin family protein [Dehalococcoidia bacterium]|nr:slipin family protein [Dehalococcoidia bacterium]